MNYFVVVKVDEHANIRLILFPPNFLICLIRRRIADAVVFVVRLIADGFFNDAGVLIATNWCGEIFEADRMEVKDGGIGYGIRRLVAERAHSAREGVDIAIALLKEYGYFHDGRTYTIADANEAWQIAIHQGNSWAAHKLSDDEVTYIPNVFMMDNVDLNDHENWKIEPGQVERANKDGRHDPKDHIFN